MANKPSGHPPSQEAPWEVLGRICHCRRLLRQGREPLSSGPAQIWTGASGVPLPWCFLLRRGAGASRDRTGSGGNRPVPVPSWCWACQAFWLHSCPALPQRGRASTCSRLPRFCRAPSLRVKGCHDVLALCRCLVGKFCSRVILLDRPV